MSISCRRDLILTSGFVHTYSLDEYNACFLGFKWMLFFFYYILNGNSCKQIGSAPFAYVLNTYFRFPV